MAALHTPVFSVIAKDLFRARLIRRHTGDAIDDFLAQLAGSFINGLPLYLEGLAYMGKVEVVIEFRCQPDLACFDSLMFALAGLREVG